MKSSLALLMLSLSFSALAETHINDNGHQLVATISDEAEARELYEGLDLEPTQGRSGSLKFFSTEDKATSILCTHSSIPLGVQYSCTLTITHEGAASPMTPVFEDGGFLNASINTTSEAQSLYDALNTNSSDGRSGTSRYFFTADKKASIQCTKSSIPIGVPYDCRVSIQN